MTLSAKTEIVESRDLLRHQLAEDIGQDAAVLVIINLDRRINAAGDRHGLHLAVGACNAERQILLRLRPRAEAEDVVDLGAVELGRVSIGSFLKLQRQHTHADEVRAMDAFEALGTTALTPSKAVLWRPSRANCRCRILSGQDQSGVPSF